jgi:predicted acylesterase/phospholipase RssA
MPGVYPVDELMSEMRPLLNANLRGRALLGDPLRVLRTGASFALPWVSRMPLVAGKLDGLLFSGARVSDLPPWIVINATSLATGKAWKFFHDRMGDYLIGATDRTADVRLADAVAASAAYPGMVDPLPMALRWEDLRSELLDRRWERPAAGPGETSRWRKRFGKARGRVVVPLVDGGIYDNEGLNSLRGAGVTHAVLSSAAPPESDRGWRRGPGALLRTVDVMHGRLGALTRQFAHEATHGTHPSEARDIAREASETLRRLAAAEPETGAILLQLAENLDRGAAVGWPPRGRQFRATAHVLLHRGDVAENRSAHYAEEPYDIHPEDRGVSAVLVDEIARVRTDLDALEPDVLDLLVAQGYFLADAQVKIAMPELVAECASAADPRGPAARPRWDWARDVTTRANENTADSVAVLRSAGRRRLPIGRCAGRAEAVRIACSVAGTALAIMAAAALAMI